ncbi:MAG: hypothetical protein ACRDN0_03850 [Trebonia sp.]
MVAVPAGSDDPVEHVRVGRVLQHLGVVDEHDVPVERVKQFAQFFQLEVRAAYRQDTGNAVE